MPTRSTALAVAIPVAGPLVTLFTVPAGFTYVVKSLMIYNGGVGPDTLYAGFKDPAGTDVYVYTNQALASAGRLEWNGWMAMNPGAQFVVFSTTGNSHFWVSGAKLEGVA
jgi:hypothetical protein